MKFSELFKLAIKMRIGFAILVSSLLLSACVTPGPKYPRLAPDVERLSIDYASFVPPKDDGWKIVAHKHNHIELTRPLKHEDEAVVIDAMSSSFHDHIPPSQFAQKLKEDWKNVDPARLTTKLHVATEVKIGQAICVRSHSKLREKKPRLVWGSEKRMIIELFSLICVEPGDPQPNFSVSYSARYYSDDKNLNLAAEASQVLNSVKLAPSTIK